MSLDQAAIRSCNARSSPMRSQLAASPDGANGSLTIHQDAKLLLANLSEGRPLEYEIAPARHAYLQVLRGEVSMAGELLQAGDGVAVSETTSMELSAPVAAEVLLFDLA